MTVTERSELNLKLVDSLVLKVSTVSTVQSSQPEMGGKKKAKPKKAVSNPKAWIEEALQQYLLPPVPQEEISEAAAAMTSDAAAASQTEVPRDKEIIADMICLSANCRRKTKINCSFR